MTGWLAEAFRLSGQTPQAIERYQAAFDAGDRNATHERNFAWLIATNPAAQTAQIRSAIALARDACDQTADNDPYSLDALAAALARSGQFDRAAKIAQQAQQNAATKNDAELVKAIQFRIALYHAGRPYPPGK
jgi:tetratricopeptide (TPR) repeat protein